MQLLKVYFLMLSLIRIEYKIYEKPHFIPHKLPNEKLGNKMKGTATLYQAITPSFYRDLIITFLKC